MAAKNKYILRSKISEAKFREFARLFCADSNATRLARATGLNRNTVNGLLMGFRYGAVHARCGPRRKSLRPSVSRNTARDGEM